MFAVKKTKYLDIELPIIVSNYRELLFDEIPVLFTGKNKYGNYIIGSSVAEDYKKGFERYFHTIVEPTKYEAYWKGKTSYLEILQHSNIIFVIDKYIRKQKEEIATVEFEDIPAKYLPTQKSYFPKSAYQPTYSYSSAIKGGLADEHLAVPEHVSTTQNQVAALFHKSLKTLSEAFGFGVEVNLAPATKSSYAINYSITLSKGSLYSLFLHENELWDYLNDFVKFCIENLPDEVEQVITLEGEAKESAFNALCNKALNILRAIQPDAKTIENTVRESIRKDVLATPEILKPVAELAVKNYTKIELTNNEFPIGSIDKEYQSKVGYVISQIEASEKEEESKSDVYEIQVFNFNKHSGGGQASLLEISDEKKLSEVWFSIEGYKDVDINVRSDIDKRFIESLIEDKFIRVGGLLNTKNGKPTKIIINSPLLF